MYRIALVLALPALLLVGLNLSLATVDEGPAPSRIVTMWKHDPVTRSISLRTGAEGLVMRKHRVLNSQSDIDFGAYNIDAFTVGVEGGRMGVIVDLGSANELEERYGYAETVGGGQGYSSIHLRDGKLLIRSAGDEFQPMREAAALFAKPERGTKTDTAPVVLGHIYLVRLTDRHEPGFERIAKLLVIGHDKEESVTIRWDLLRDVGGRRR